MSRTETFNRPLSVLFDDETKSKLEALTDKGRVSQGHVIRQAINFMHAHQVLQRPTCANGNNCHCPHTHSFPPRS